MANDHKQNDREQNSGGVLAVAAVLLIVVMLPILYVLGLGPAVWLHKQGFATEAIETIYIPLVLSLDYLGPVKGMLEWYVSFWE